MMGEYSDALFGASSPPKKPEKTKYSDELFQGIDPQKVQVKSDTKHGAGHLDIAVSSFASDHDEAIRWYASRMYPKEPLEQAVKRFGTVGDKIYHIPDMKNPNVAYQVIPDQSWTKRPLTGVGPSIPAVVGGTVGILTAPLMATGIGAGASIAATSGAGAAGEVARQKIGDVIFGDDVSTGDMNTNSVIAEGVMAGAGQGIGKGTQAVTERMLAKDFADFGAGQTAENYAKAKHYGIKVTPAEASDLPSLKADQKRLGNITPTSNKMGKFYEERNQQVDSAWGRFIDYVSENGDADDVARMTRDAAKGAIDTAKEARRKVAQPIYKRTVTPDNVVEDYTPSKLVKSVIEKIRKDPVFDTVDGVPDNSMTMLDLAKRELDDMAEAARRAGENNRARLISQSRDKMVSAMDKAFPEYAGARGAFAAGSEGVDELINGTVKVIADLKDRNLQRFVLEILNPTTRSPRAVARARMAIEKANPEAWQGVKRIYLQSVANRALKITQSGEVLNPAGKLYSAFMDAPTRANLKTAMNAGEWSVFNDLMDVFRMASRVKQMGSDTAWNLTAQKEAADKARPWFVKISRNFNPAQALRTFEEWATNRAVDKHAKAMVNVVTSGNPEAVKVLKELRKLSPSDMRWRALFGHLLVRGSEVAAN